MLNTKKGSEHVMSALCLMDELAEKLNITPEAYDKYASIVRDISGGKGMVLDDKTRRSILEFISEVKPNEGGELYNVSEGSSDEDLLSLLSLILRSISWVQDGNFLLVKYNKVIFKTGWHKLATQCRGKVLHIYSRQVVSFPFNKFFNLNETAETNEERIRGLLDKASSISVTDKMDGSLISVCNWGKIPLITTNGGFDNIQIDLAKQLFREKYRKFYEDIPEGYTFMFELIHPENKIVVDYGDEKDLYLLGARKLDTGRLLSYSELKYYSTAYGFKLPKLFEYKSLDEFIDMASSDVFGGKEGWVFRVVTSDEDLLFKLKYVEYFKLARIKAAPSVEKVYNLMLSGGLDDVLSSCEGELRKTIEDQVAEIFDSFDAFKVRVNKIHAKFLASCSKEDLSEKESGKALWECVRDSAFAPYVMRLHRGFSLEDMFDSLPTYKVYEAMAKELFEKEA